MDKTRPSLLRIGKAADGTRIAGSALPSNLSTALSLAADRDNWPIRAVAVDVPRWHEVSGQIDLYDAPHGVRPRQLIMEWPGDHGPVTPLRRLRRETLVRCPDGTAGWTSAELGNVVPAPLCASPSLDLKGLRRVAQSFLGVPYRLGGGSGDGIDCSALIQRVYFEAFSILLPRHSRDQMLAFDTGSTRARRAQEGDVIFLRVNEGLHAGVACRLTDDRPVRIVHAAPSRGVVADSMAAYGRIGDVISIGRAEIAFALALLSQGLPTSTLWTAIHRRAIMRATK
jgi:hypothetical protein